MKRFLFTLQEIERAIIANCAIDKEAGKKLQLVKYWGTKNKGIGRLLFIFLAHYYGYDMDEITEHLDMSDEEYYSKLAKLDYLYSEGKDLFEKYSQSPKKLNFHNSDELSLFFYRKLKLTENYMKYKKRRPR